MKHRKLKIAILVILLAALAITIGILRQPNIFYVTESATIGAPPAAVFAEINDLRRWEAWSPWAKMDPKAVITYEGPPQGMGAEMGWNGNSSVGAGSMKIVDSEPGARVRLRLMFEAPMKSWALSEFTLAPQKDGQETQVTWSMYSHCNVTCKAMGLFMNCRKMVGEQYAEGLANLKAVVEQ